MAEPEVEVEEAGARQRMFVALRVEQPAHAALERVVGALRDAHPPLRWVDPGTWHITLAFLGGVTGDRLAALDAVAAEVAAQTPALPIRLDGGAGTFGGSVLYASVEDNPALSALAAALGSGLREAGFGVEDRHFVPHCTLARVSRGARLPPQVLGDYAGPAVTWTTRELLVLRSRLKIGGAVHEMRSAHPLSADAAGA